MFIVCQGLRWESSLHKLLSLMSQFCERTRLSLSGKWINSSVKRMLNRTTMAQLMGRQSWGSNPGVQRLGADLPPTGWSVCTSVSTTPYRTLSLGSNSTSFWNFRFPIWEPLEVGSWALSASPWQRWHSNYHIPAARTWLCSCSATVPFCYNTVHTQGQN